MRSYSFFTIILLCLAILLVDALSFYWLQSITQLLQSVFLQNFIHITFWTFTIGLITAIILLRLRLKVTHPYLNQLLIT
ncbi:MAG: metallophosphoesterase, partial [Lutibacter sp.]|nr:metallophosphoesterase [Lutibacter sp.]